jgi:hypothetical protein
MLAACKLSNRVRQGRPVNDMNKPLNDQDVNRGIDLFNRAHFFDAHEVLVLDRRLDQGCGCPRLLLHHHPYPQLP